MLVFITKVIGVRFVSEAAKSRHMHAQKSQTNLLVQLKDNLCRMWEILALDPKVLIHLSL